ncbi:MAG: hypothetical protein ACK4E8_06055 [Lacibacter sp.]
MTQATVQELADAIRTAIGNTTALEDLYRNNPAAFREAFGRVYPELAGTPVADAWQARLNYKKQPLVHFRRNEWMFLGVLAVIAGLLAKVPAFTDIEAEFYYSRNIGFIVFPALAVWFARKNHLPLRIWVWAGGAFLVSVVYINLLPYNPGSNTLLLACIHLLLVLWGLTGMVFTQGAVDVQAKRLDYLRYNADLLVMSALLLLAGGILSGITVALFELIGIRIERFYFENIVVFVLPAVPLLATHLTQSNPNLVGRVAPVIARIFSPIVLVMLVVYLGAMVYAGKDPYRDREFLLLFNALLIGVMALIFFAAAEATTDEKKQGGLWILLLLALVTIAVNGVALSAIVFRIAEWGFTPNRTAVLGSNVFMLINLLLIARQLLRAVRTRNNGSGVYRVMAAYLPVYVAWAALVTFLFPVLFGFK